MDATRGHWLKAVGHARGPLREGWLDERPGAAAADRVPAPAADRAGRPARLLRLGLAPRVRRRRGDRGARAAGAPALAVDDRRRAAAGRARARCRPAGRGDRRRSALDEPAVAHPAGPGALRASGRGARIRRGVRRH